MTPKTSTRSRIARKLAISAATLFLLVVLAELGLRLAGYARSPARYYDPAVGYRFHPGQTRTMFGPGRVPLADVRLNELGLRGPAPRRTLREGEARLVCLGDSFTFGWAVDDDETYPALLAAALAALEPPPEVEVSNFGMPGYNTADELRQYEVLVRPLAPRIAVLGFFLNDLEPSFAAVPNTNSWAYRLLGRTALLELFHELVGPRSALFRPAQSEAEKAYVEAFHANRQRIYEAPDSPVARPYVEACFDALERLVLAVRADGVELLIVAFPSRQQVDRVRNARRAGGEAGAAVERAAVAALQERLAAFGRARSVPVLDLLGPFVESSEDPFGKVDRGHPSPAGNRVAAEEVLAALRAKGWL